VLRLVLTRVTAGANVRGPAVRRRPGCGLMLAVSVSCTAFEPGTDELTEPMPLMQEQQLGPGRDWSCLDERPAPSMLVNSPLGAQPLNQSVKVTDLASGLVPPGVTVRACSQPDIDCLMPLTERVPLDDEGWVTLPLYEGFDGYIEIEGETIVSTLLIYADPLTVEIQVDPEPFAVVTRALLPRLSLATGVQQDPNLGLVHLRMFDCQRVAAPGVTFSINQEDAWRWYFVGELPTSLADETTESGLGGFINVRPGIALVSAELRGSPIALASDESVFVRAGWMTGVRFFGQAATR
jgi:hypothetical protein